MFKYLGSALLFLLLGLSGVSQAMPSVVEDLRSQPVALDRKEPFFLYLNYGDPANKTQYDQSFATVSISSTSINFVSNNLYEIKRNDPNNTSCSANTLGTEYPITFDLVQNSTLQYGFGSATAVGQPSGSKSAPLAPKQTGCLKIGLKVMPSAKQSEEVSITYKQNTINSEGQIVSIKDVPEKAVLFSLGKVANCSGDLVSVGTQCLPACKDNEYRTASGTCTSKQITCSSGEELFGDKCVPICAQSEARNTFGECKKSSTDYSGVISMIVVGILTLVALIVISMIVFGIARNLRKRL